MAELSGKCERLQMDFAYGLQTNVQKFGNADNFQLMWNSIHSGSISVIW